MKMKTKTNSKTKTKRIVTLLLALLFTAALALSGCASGGDEPKSDEGDKDVPRIGLIQLMEHPSLDTIRSSLIAELASQGFIDGDTCIIDYQNGQGDQNNMKTIAQKFKADGCDMIIAIATPAAQAVLGETSDIPIIFSAVTDPVEAGLVKDPEHPGANITGTSDLVSAAKIMELAQKITPDFKTIGALYNSGEANSLSVIEDLKEYAEQNGLKVIESPLMNQSEAQQAASALVGKVDIVFSPIDNSVASTMPIVTQVFDNAQIPFYVSADSMVMTGGLATYGINYKVLGKETGEMAVQVLNGADPGTLPVRTMSEMSIYVNTDVAKRAGVTFPQDVLDSATVFTDADANNAEVE